MSTHSASANAATGVATAVTAVATGAAGVIHLRFGPSHLEEDAIYGAFFFVTGALQILGSLVLGVAVVKRAVPGRRVWMPLFLFTGFIVAVWVVTRTLGPPVGANAGQREPVAFADLVAAGLHLVSLGGLALIAQRAGARTSRSNRRAGAIAALATALFALPLAAAAEPEAHSALCEPHEDDAEEGPLAAVYAGHVMIKPPLPLVHASVGETATALVGKFVNCADEPVVALSTETIGYQDPVGPMGPVSHILDWSVGPLDGTDRDSLSAGPVTIPVTAGEPELGLYVTVAADVPGLYRLHNVAIDVREGSQTVRQTFATIARVEVRP